MDFQLYDIYYELLINIFLVLSSDKHYSVSQGIYCTPRADVQQSLQPILVSLIVSLSTNSIVPQQLLDLIVSSLTSYELEHQGGSFKTIEDSIIQNKFRVDL